MLEQIVEKQNAFGLLAAALADCEQARQASPGVAVLRIGENVGRAVGEDEPRADDEFQRRKSMPLAFRSRMCSFNCFERA